MSFMKKGLREHKLFERKKVQKHTKEFYKILGYMDNVAVDMRKRYPEVDFTEDNIDEYIKPHVDRELDSMERFLVLGKLSNNKKQENEQEQK